MYNEFTEKRRVFISSIMYIPTTSPPVLGCVPDTKNREGQTVVTPENSLDRLKSLGIFVKPEVVMTIVRHLKNGGVQRDLYNATPGIKPVASNKTVLKVKTLLDAKKLNWMTDELARLNATIDTIPETSDKDQQRLIKRIKGWDIEKDDGQGEFRLEIVEEVEEALNGRGFEWSIAHLKETGFPLKDALETLQEYDALYMERTTAEIYGNDYRYLLKFRGFDDYLTLLHRVYLMKKYPKSPNAHMEKAIAIYTRGVLEGDDSISIAGENILRY